MNTSEHLVSIGDTRLFVAERGNGYPLIVLHGGPGLDHHMFGDYLDPLTDSYRLILVDERAQGRSEPASESTWTLPQMARDVSLLAESLGLKRYAVLGHSYGSFVALQHAVDFPGMAAQTIVSSGIPAARYLEKVWRNLEAFEPVELRKQVTDSWEREKVVQTHAECVALLHDQLPFQFGDPLDPRIADYERRTADGVYSAAVLRHFANLDYGGIEVEDRLSGVTQPVLVLAGRLDRTCSVEAAEAIAAGIPHAELVVFEHSGHMTFVEENEAYLNAVRGFLDRHR
ncbi:MAG: alpha/beta fold hydrolase [Aggregatilineales bacterium]